MIKKGKSLGLVQVLASAGKLKSKKSKVGSESSNPMVNHPKHYQGGKFEVIDIIEEYKLNFNLGNVCKYILRSGKKDDCCQDLEKAQWYLAREIANLKSGRV